MVVPQDQQTSKSSSTCSPHREQVHMVGLLKWGRLLQADGALQRKRGQGLGALMVGKGAVPFFVGKPAGGANYLLKLAMAVGRSAADSRGTGRVPPVEISRVTVRTSATRGCRLHR